MKTDVSEKALHLIKADIWGQKIYNVCQIKLVVEWWQIILRGTDG